MPNKKRLLTISLLVLLAVSPFLSFYDVPLVRAIGIIRVQGNARGTATSGSTIAVTLGAAPTSGNVLIAVYGAVVNPATTVSSITQTGVTWTQKTVKLHNNYYESEIWLGVVGAGASTSVTLSLSGSIPATYAVVADICEYYGVATTTDKTATNGGGSVYPDTGTTANTTQATELWIGGTVLSSYTQSTPTNGFTLLDGALTGYTSTAYLEKIASAIGTANSGTTGAASGQWSGCIATFKALTAVSVTLPQTVTVSSSLGSGKTLTWFESEILLFSSSSGFQKALTKYAAETLLLLDSLGTQKTIAQVLTEVLSGTMTLTDALAHQISIFVTHADALNLLDSLGAQKTLIQALTEALTDLLHIPDTLNPPFPLGPLLMSGEEAVAVAVSIGVFSIALVCALVFGYRRKRDS
jgi:hypothetical protein